MAVTYQLVPVVPANADYKSINVNLTNNDPGAIYNSGVISGDILGNLADQLWSLPANQTHYGSLEQMMGDWSLNVRSPPTGDIYSGWNNTLNADGSVNLSNIGGRPGDYDQWSSTPGQNTMALTLRIPLAQLEADGVPGYNPETDARILLGTNQIENAFVGVSESGYTQWSAPMNQYDVHVIPEPSSLALVGTAMAILAGRKMKCLGSKVKGMFKK